MRLGQVDRRGVHECRAVDVEVRCLRLREGRTDLRSHGECVLDKLRLGVVASHLQESLDAAHGKPDRVFEEALASDRLGERYRGSDSRWQPGVL